MKQIGLAVLLPLLALTVLAKDTVVFVGAHPDDLEACMGLALRMKDDYDFRVVDFTRGEGGCGPEGFRDGTTAVKRMAEERAVCRELGCEPVFLSQTNFQGRLAFADARVTRELEELLWKLRPKAVLAHWPVDSHPDHVQCSAAVQHAISNLGRDRKFKTELYFYEEPPWQTFNYRPTYYVDVTAQEKKALELCRLYACQDGEHLAKNKARRLRVRGAEAPRPAVCAEAYTTLTGEPVAGGVLERYAIRAPEPASVKPPRIFLWTELIAFDTAQRDFGVGEYLSRMTIKPEMVALLLGNEALYFNHRAGLPEDFELTANCCSSADGRPFNSERRAQRWTAFQVRDLVAELDRHGVKTLASFFARNDRFPVPPERAAWMAPRLAQFIEDYGFAGFHGADGYAPPRYLLPACEDRDRARIAREWARRYADNWKTLVTPLKEKGKVCWINTCWTRDPFESLYRYGVDHRLIAEAGVDGFVVESSAAMQEISGWNHQESSAIDRSTAMLMRLKASVPNTPLVLLHAINDGWEQWSAMRHDPTRTASEALALGSVFYGNRRALEGYLACLADGITTQEWHAVNRVWQQSFLPAKEPLGARVVWSDRAFETEFEASVTNKFANSNTLLAEVIHQGGFVGGSVSVKDALADRSLPLVILNPAYFPADELAALRDRLVKVFEFGLGATAPRDHPYVMLPPGTPVFPGMPNETSCYWKKPIPEHLPHPDEVSDFAWHINWEAAPFMPETAGVRIFGYRLADGRVAAFARNDGNTYLKTVLKFKNSISDVEVLRDFPSLPVRTGLNVKIAPHDTLMLSVGEHEQPIPGTTCPR